MRLVGRPEFIDEPWFTSGAERAKHADELDEAVGSWIAERDRDEVMRAFEEADAAVAPIYNAKDILEDPQFNALGTIKTLEDEELGPIRMQNVLFRLSETPGEIKHSGFPQGHDTEAVLRELGKSDDEIAQLRDAGAV
jgi:formyl-CoA transferase